MENEKISLKSLREQRGWYQSDLATFLDVERSTISKWENGTHAPDRYLTKRLAELFEVPFETIDRLFIDRGKGCRHHY